jgi:hypothetical protein
MLDMLDGLRQGLVRRHDGRAAHVVRPGSRQLHASVTVGVPYNDGMPDVALLRRDILRAIENARRDAADQRTKRDAARRAYETFLADQAIPVFRAFAAALKAEGMMFEVMTPQGGVRLVAARNREDAIEVEFDVDAEPPQVVLRTTRGRGSRTLRTEQPLKPGAQVTQLTEDDVVQALMAAIVPWLV